MQKTRLTLAAAVAAALAVPWGNANAQAKEGIQLQLSGQINRGVMIADDGVRSDTFHVDNDNSSTRFRFLGSAPLGTGLRAGFLWEMEYQSNPSNAVNFASRSLAGPTLDERHIDLFFEGGWGKLSFGQGDGAANGSVEVDLSGTSVAHYSDLGAVGGGIDFRTSAGALSGTTPSDVMSNQDFESRYDRVRYDTPSVAGFSVAASLGAKDSDQDVKEIALRYSGELAGLGRIAGAVGFSRQDTPTFDEDTLGGSISWLHTSGLNLTFGYTEKELGPVDSQFYYGKVGYKVGRHAVSLDLGRGEDQELPGDEGQAVSLAYVFQPVAWAEIYALVKRFSLDRSGASLQDIDTAMIGTRLRF